MRRPLFTACLCLVTIIAIGKILTGADTGGDPSLPPDGSPVKITGRIDTKTSEEMILSTISIFQENQQYSYSGKLQCVLTNVKSDVWKTIPETVESRGQTDGASQSIGNNIPQDVNEKAESQTFKIGQLVMIEGIFSEFTRATNPGEFDVRAYYQSKGIGGKVKKAQIVAVGKDYSFFREILYRCRLRLHDRLAKVFPAKEASVMQTLLLGEKEELDADVKALYQKNGIAHILSISGLHITLLGMGLYQLLKRMGVPVKAAATIGAAVLIGYGMMVGMSVSACRAIGMYVLRMFGIFVGRTYDMLTGVGVMALLLAVQKPERLWDVSFLMSFGAVLGICLLTPVLAGSKEEKDQNNREKKAGEKPEDLENRQSDIMAQETLKNEQHFAGMREWLRTIGEFLVDSVYEKNKHREGWRKVLYEQSHKVLEAAKSGFAASAGVILFTLPIQLWFFYEIPVYSVLLNLLVLPFMSVVMVGGLIALIPGLGIVGTVDCLILWWYEWICERFGELPGAIWCVGRPGVWQIIVYYAGLLGVILLQNHGDNVRRLIEKSKEYCRRLRKNNIQSKRRTARGNHNSISIHNPVSILGHGMWAMIRKLSALIKNKKFTLCACLMVLLFLLTGDFDCSSSVTFLDVGQGDGIVVETSQGVYLFDCGSTSRKKIGEYVLKPYLKSRGISSLRGVFVSHPDEDHMNGVLELLENGEEWGITVEQLFLPAIEESRREEAFDKLLNAAETAGTQVNYIKCGDEIRESRMHLLCLHPEANTTLADANAYSECFYLEIERGKLLPARLSEWWNRLLAFAGSEGDEPAGTFPEPGLGILLTGDVEGEGERQLLQELQKMREQQGEMQAERQGQSQQEPQGRGQAEVKQEMWEERLGESLQDFMGEMQGESLKEMHGKSQDHIWHGVGILKVAHHGSGYSTGSEFLTTVDPAAAIISCGRNNSYGHPHAETLQRLEDAEVPWYCTMDYGAMTVTVNRDGKIRLRGYVVGK